MHTELKSEAVMLRRKGYLFSEISKELGVAKSTASAWTSRIDLSEVERSRLLAKQAALSAQKVRLLNNQRRVIRKHRDKMIALEAANSLNNLTLTKEHKRLLCATFFWCEGGKSIGNGIRFINSDPVMVRTFLNLLRQSFEVDESKFRALLHLHEYHNDGQQLKYWSNVTEIPASQFYRSYLKPHTGKNTRKGYPGCISVRYQDVPLGKLLQMIYIRLSESL